MGPKPPQEPNDHDVFRTELVNLIHQQHELVRQAELNGKISAQQKYGLESQQARLAAGSILLAAGAAAGLEALLTEGLMPFHRSFCRERTSLLVWSASG